MLEWSTALVLDGSLLLEVGFIFCVSTLTLIRDKIPPTFTVLLAVRDSTQVFKTP